MPGREAVTFVELADWMRKNRWKLRPFAVETDIDKMTLHRLLSGKLKRFSPDIIVKIDKATGGKVGAQQFGAYFTRLRKAA